MPRQCSIECWSYDEGISTTLNKYEFSFSDKSRFCIKLRMGLMTHQAPFPVLDRTKNSVPCASIQFPSHRRKSSSELNFLRVERERVFAGKISSDDADRETVEETPKSATPLWPMSREALSLFLSRIPYYFVSQRLADSNPHLEGSSDLSIHSENPFENFLKSNFLSRKTDLDFTKIDYLENRSSYVLSEMMEIEPLRSNRLGEWQEQRPHMWILFLIWLSSGLILYSRWQNGSMDIILYRICRMYMKYWNSPDIYGYLNQEQFAMLISIMLHTAGYCVS